jgi:hypothetical protein
MDEEGRRAATDRPRAFEKARALKLSFFGEALASQIVWELPCVLKSIKRPRGIVTIVDFEGFGEAEHYCDGEPSVKLSIPLFLFSINRVVYVLIRVFVGRYIRLVVS